MFTINLEYDVRSRPRYGHGKPRHKQINDILNRNRRMYRDTIRSMTQYADVFRLLSTDDDPRHPTEPFWNNGFLPGLDIASLYYFVSQSDAACYLEVGSGNSTMVARRAIKDQRLRTSIVSIDPQPRASIDSICDRVIRQPLEAVALDVFDELKTGDILYIDSSHRVFMNSDVTVFFLDILPRLAAGVLVHIHDVFLPDDYPPEWIERYYSEQYMLACLLLSDSPRFDVVLPNHFVFTDDELRESVTNLWAQVGIAGIAPHGGSFWMRMR